MKLIPSDTRNFLYPVTLIRVETGGVLKLLLADHRTVEIPVYSGALINLPVLRIFATGTTASGFHNNLLSPADTDAEVPYGPAASPPPPATPQLTGGTVNPNGTTFSLTFSGAVAADFAGISFTLDGTPVAAFGYINGTGTVVSGEIYSTVYQGQTVTVSGGGVPFLVSSPGGVGVSFSGVTITNGSEQAPVPPGKIDVFRMDPSTISVLFDQNVSGDSFTGSVTVDGGTPVAVSFGDYLGPNQITLVCAEALPPGVTLLTCTATNLVGSPGGVPVETFADYPVS